MHAATASRRKLSIYFIFYSPTFHFFFPSCSYSNSGSDALFTLFLSRLGKNNCFGHTSICMSCNAAHGLPSFSWSLSSWISLIISILSFLRFLPDFSRTFLQIQAMISAQQLRTHSPLSSFSSPPFLVSASFSSSLFCHSYSPTFQLAYSLCLELLQLQLFGCVE